MAKHTREEVFEAFKQAVVLVWSNGDELVPLLRMTTEEPSDDVLASLVFASYPKTLGRCVYRPADFYALRVSDACLDLEPAALRGVMIHEAVHVGVRGHGSRFIQTCQKYGGTISGATAKGEKTAELVLEVQDERGKRFRQLEKFPADGKLELMAFVLALKVAFPRSRYRIVY